MQNISRGGKVSALASHNLKQIVKQLVTLDTVKIASDIIYKAEKEEKY